MARRWEEVRVAEGKRVTGKQCGENQQRHERSRTGKKDKKSKRYRLKTAARERKKKDESTIDDSTSMEIRRGGSGDELCPGSPGLLLIQLLVVVR